MRGGMVAEKNASWRGSGSSARIVFHVFQEAQRQHLVGFVQHAEPDVFQRQRPAPQVIQDAARRADHDLRPVAQGAELPVQRLPAVDRHDAQPRVLGQVVDAACDLHGQFPRRLQHQRLRLGPARRRIFWISGRANAAVLPVPVCACPIRSRPASRGGMARA